MTKHQRSDADSDHDYALAGGGCGVGVSVGVGSVKQRLEGTKRKYTTSEKQNTSRAADLYY
jgi:hypothetical protein